MNRKEFINNSVRYGILALLVGLIAFFVTNRKTTVEKQCTNDLACGNCGKRENCNIKKK
jgi:hypothetical protein